MPQEPRAGHMGRASPILLSRLLVRVGAGLILAGAVLFALAGRLSWAGGWLFLGLMVATMAANAAVLSHTNPDVIRARWGKRRVTEPFDKVFLALYTPTLTALPMIAALDARLAWSSPALWTAGLGVLLHVAGNLPLVWAMAVNPYSETTVRIQAERGHHVVTSGPYRLVRHPMYVGVLLMFAGWPLVLGSLWAYLSVVALVPLFVFRTAREDRLLCAELPGYQEYAQRTRHRLVPGMW